MSDFCCSIYFSAFWMESRSSPYLCYFLMKSSMNSWVVEILVAFLMALKESSTSLNSSMSFFILLRSTNLRKS